MGKELTVVSNELSYEQLDDETKARVDERIEELREINPSGLLTWGIESQTKVTSHVNSMLTKITSGDKVENIDEIIEEVLDVSKPFMNNTEKKGFFQRLFAPRVEAPKIDTIMFAGKVESLVSAIDTQIGRLVSDNIMYDEYIDLLIENVNSIRESIMALERYIEEIKANQTAQVIDENGQDMTVILRNTEIKNLLEQLERKLNMLRVSHQESMQVAVSTRLIQNNNDILSNRLYNLLVNGVPILQNQIMLKASMQDTKRGLDMCDKVSGSIDAAMKENAEQLRELTGRIGTSDSTAISAESIVDMSANILSIADELKKVNDKAKDDLGNVHKQIRQSDASLAELFNKLSVNRGKE